MVLLAAGASARMGRPKQLLQWAGTSLLQHALRAATGATAHPVILVLGAGADQLEKEAAGYRLQTVVNADWQEGMASSIRCGIGALLQLAPAATAAVLTVCDQPYVTAALLNELIRAHQITGKPIVSCGYEGTFGPPTLFHKNLFGELLRLSGDVGARGLVRRHLEQAELIPFPSGRIDVDTRGDYEQLIKQPS